jgi:hypothetical protein
MDLVNIFSEAIRKGSSSSQQEVKRDLAFLITLVNDFNSFSSQVNTLLVGDTLSLDWLNDIKNLSNASPPPKFGPVLATEGGAAERLALCARLCSRPQISSEIKSFVEASSADLPTIFSISKQVQTYLDGAEPSKRLWVAEVTPVFLQKTLENQSNLLELSDAATGGELPSKWNDIENWVDIWTISPNRRNPQKNLGVDGFFNAHHSNYQPAAIHPLILRILRRSFLSQLNAGGGQEEIPLM